MTIIRPISELSKRMAYVEAFVVEQDTPAHLTKNGSKAEIRQGKSIPAHLAFGER